MNGTNSSADNTSGLHQVFAAVQKLTLVMFCLIVIVGTLGNGIVIYVTGFRMKRTVNSVLFCNLAMADFLFSIFLIFFTVSLTRNHQWPFGRIMCKLATFVSVVNMFTSIFLLAAISLDRCLLSWLVVWAHNQRTVCKAQIVSAVIWVMAMACSIPYTTPRDLVPHEGGVVCHNSYVSQEHIRNLTIFRFVMGFLIPFLIISVAYVAIGVRARRLGRSNRKRPVRIVCSIILAFFICWLPFHVMSILGLNPYFRDIVRIGGTLSNILAYMNSCLNPILYVFMCDEFQKKLKQSVCHVLESALAEDHMSFMSSRSLSSHFSRTRKSDSGPSLDRKDTAITLKFTEAPEAMPEEKEVLSPD